MNTPVFRGRSAPGTSSMMCGGLLVHSLPTPGTSLPAGTARVAAAVMLSVVWSLAAPAAERGPSGPIGFFSKIFSSRDEEDERNARGRMNAPPGPPVTVNQGRPVRSLPIMHDPGELPGAMVGRDADPIRRENRPEPESSEPESFDPDAVTPEQLAEIATAAVDSLRGILLESVWPGTLPGEPDGETAHRQVPASDRSQSPPRVPFGHLGTAAPPPENARLAALRKRIARTLATYHRRQLNTRDHTSWEIMHAFLAFGLPARVHLAGPTGEPVSSIGWLNMGGRCRGQSLLEVRDGELVAIRGYGVQGHSAQYLAMLAQCRVSPRSPIVVDSRPFTVADLIESEKRACRPKTELTFALIAMAHYLPSDAAWASSDGGEWTLERLVEEELAQPVNGAPCGGTHRLFGLSYACQRRRQAVGSLDGAYARANDLVRNHQVLTLTRLQNRDGSLSTEWFKRPADREDDIERKVQTTGHMLEWIVASIDQESLYHERVTRCVEFLTRALAADPGHDWKIGPMSHALHALTIYQERMWGTVLPGGVAQFGGAMKTSLERPVESIVRRPNEPRGRQAPGGASGGLR
jgi:hypothetical protein